MAKIYDFIEKYYSFVLKLLLILFTSIAFIWGVGQLSYGGILTLSSASVKTNVDTVQWGDVKPLYDQKQILTEDEEEAEEEEEEEEEFKPNPQYKRMYEDLESLFENDKKIFENYWRIDSSFEYKTGLEGFHWFMNAVKNGVNNDNYELGILRTGDKFPRGEQLALPEGFAGCYVGKEVAIDEQYQEQFDDNFERYIGQMTSPGMNAPFIKIQDARARYVQVYGALDVFICAFGLNIANLDSENNLNAAEALAKKATGGILVGTAIELLKGAVIFFSSLSLLGLLIILARIEKKLGK